MDQHGFLLSDAAWKRGHAVILTLAVISWAACALGYATAPQQFYASYLAGYMYFLTIALGAAFFVMLQHLTGAVWSVTVRRLMETVMATLPVAALLFVPIAAGLPTLYEWARPEFYSSDPDLRFKMLFFSPAFFFARAAVYFAVWCAISISLYRRSVAQDRNGDIDAIRKSVFWSAPGLVLLFVRSADW